MAWSSVDDSQSRTLVVNADLAGVARRDYRSDTDCSYCATGTETCVRSGVQG